MRPSLFWSNIWNIRSLMMPGKLQYSVNVTLSSFFCCMASGYKLRILRSRYKSFRYGDKKSLTNLLSVALSKSITFIRAGF